MLMFKTFHIKHVQLRSYCENRAKLYTQKLYFMLFRVFWPIWVHGFGRVIIVQLVQHFNLDSSGRKYYSMYVDHVPCRINMFLGWKKINIPHLMRQWSSSFKLHNLLCEYLIPYWVKYWYINSWTKLPLQYGSGILFF